MLFTRVFTKIRNEYGPDATNDYLHKYFRSINFGSGLGTDFFTTFEGTRVGNTHQLKMLDEKSFDERFLKTDDVKREVGEVKAGLAKAFQLTAETLKARDDLKQELQAVNKLLTSKTDEFFSPAALQKYLQNVKTTVGNALSAQKEVELAAVKTLFTTQNFRTACAASLGLPNEATISNTEKELLAALEKTRNEEKSKFDKAFDEEINKFNLLIEQETARIAFYAAAKANQDMANTRAAIAEQQQEAQEKRAAANAVVLEMELNDESIQFENLDPKLLKNLESMTGKPLSKNADGSFSISFAKFDLWSFFNPHQKQDYDIFQIIYTLKATGVKKIIINASASDKEDALEVARKTYLACLRAKYEPANIKIKVNGELKKVDDLRAGHEARFQAVENEVHEWKTRTEEVPVFEAENLKARLEKIKNVPEPVVPVQLQL